MTRLDVLPPGVPSWGKEFKDFYTRYYTRTMDLNMQPETLPHGSNRVDLDPRHRDRWGVPLPRVTFEFHQNEQRLQKYLAGVGEKIMQATGANRVWTEDTTGILRLRAQLTARCATMSGAATWTRLGSKAARSRRIRGDRLQAS